ncbi:helicase-associated domain-containing protein [Actinomyces bovis]|nr:helicase-associated domain-containing protein [Actinomyces bovis]
MRDPKPELAATPAGTSQTLANNPCSAATTADLAAQLTALADAEMLGFLRQRPDLVTPPASSITALAARAAGHTSVELALARLDGPTLAVAQQVVATAPQTAPATKTPPAQPQAPLRAAQLATHISQHLGLEVSAVAACLARLEHLALLVGGAPVTGLVELLAPRAGAPAPYPVAPPSPKELEQLPTDVVAAESTRHAEEAVRLVAALLTEWGWEGGAILRNGGVGVRTLTRTAQALGIDQATTATISELAAAAGLLGLDEEGTSWVPSSTAYTWARATLPERWAQLAAAWASSLRTPWLVGSRGDDGTLRAALHDDLEATWARALRRRLLQLFTTLPEGASATPTWVRAALTFARPRRPAPKGAVTAVLAEAELLGLTGAGAPSRAGLALAAVTLQVAGGGPASATDPSPLGATPPDELSDLMLAPLETALEADLPTPVSLLLLQSDLTAVVPGRPTPVLAELLEQASAVESRGFALTVRFTPESVRAALDAGHSAESLLSALAAFSPTPLPSALEVLVRDVQRHHGGVRVRQVAAVLQVPDLAVAAGLVADSRLAALGLAELAPGVLAATASPGQVLRELRAAGLAPVLEDAQGQVLLGEPGQQGRRRSAPAPQRPGGAPFTRRRAASDRELAVLVRRLRAGEEERARSGAPAGEATDPVHALALLRQAQAARTPVRLVVADPVGGTQERRVRVLAVDAGRVRLADLTRETELTVAVHRIVSVRPQ